MKDVVITAKRLKKELNIFLVLFIIAFVLNIISIAVYKTEWKELITQIGIVFIIALVLYILIGFIRLLVLMIKFFV